MAEEYGTGTGLEKINNEIKQNIRNRNRERRKNIVRRLKLSPTRAREPSEANVVEANVSGLSNKDYNSCEYLRTLDTPSVVKLMYDGLVKREPIQSTINRTFVMLYLKYKKSDLLTEENITNSYTIPNDPNFPLELEKKQLDELRTIVKKYTEKNNSHFADTISIELFNTDPERMHKDIKLWEKPGKFIYRNTECFTVMQGDTGLSRYIPSLLQSDLIMKYKLELSSFFCLTPSPIGFNPKERCVAISRSVSGYIQYMDILHDKSKYEYIVINNFMSPGFYDFNKFNQFTYLQMMISYGNMALIHPRLGFIIQNSYPELWAKRYWIADDRYDPITRIVILTLQKYSAIRRYYGTGDYYGTEDDAWSSALYKQNPFDPQIAYELKNPQITLARYDFNEQEFLEELIDNQVWAMLSPGKYNDYEKYKLSNNKNLHNQTYKNSVSVPYNTLEDLNSLLPTPPGFTTRFYWQVYDTNNINKPKTKLRHRNVLRYISTVKRNRNKNINGANTAKNMVNMWNNIGRVRKAPQYATQNTINSYYRDFFNTNPPLPIFPNVPKPKGPAPKNWPLYTI